MNRYLLLLFFCAPLVAHAEESNRFLEKPNSSNKTFYIKVAENSEEPDFQKINTTQSAVKIEDEVEPESQPEPEVEESRSIFDVLFGGSSIDEDEHQPSGNEVTVSDDTNGEFVGSGVIKVIDRTIGKLYLVEAQVGSKSYVNELTIKLRNCWSSSEPSLSMDSKAFIEVYETRGKNQMRLFSGWMLSKHPALSYMEHPKYDISLMKCAAPNKHKKEDKAEELQNEQIKPETKKEEAPKLILKDEKILDSESDED